MVGPVLAGIGAGVAAGGVLLWRACAVPQSQLLGPALIRGPAQGNRVALTFDDGPTPPFTDRVLDILRDRAAVATFFVCGRNVERYPDVARRIRAEGHTIGNHTYSHPYLYFQSRARIAEEIDRTQEIIQNVLGEQPQIFRPPYGGRWFSLHSLLRERGMRLVQWSDSSRDWELEAEAVSAAILRNLRSGSIILLHDGREALPYEDGIDCAGAIGALPSIIDGARSAGLEFVPVNDFLIPG